MISKAMSVFSKVLTLKAMRCQSRAKEPADGVIWIVLAAARSIPILDNCLAVDLTMKFFLNAESCPTVLSIEGAKGDLRQLKAHAWSESESGLLIGSAKDDWYAASPLFYGVGK